MFLLFLFFLASSSSASSFLTLRLILLDVSSSTFLRLPLHRHLPLLLIIILLLLLRPANLSFFFPHSILFVGTSQLFLWMKAKMPSRIGSQPPEFLKGERKREFSPSLDRRTLCLSDINNFTGH